MKIVKWFAALAVLSLLLAPALSAHTVTGCACTSGGCNSSHVANCCSKCSEESCYSQGYPCHCYISSFPCDVSDPGYSYFSQSSSRSHGRESRMASSSCHGNGSICQSQSQVNHDGIGPPDWDVIEYLPPSAKQVFSVLASYGPMTQKDLINKTDLPPRTVRYALGRLKEERVIRECFYFPDARQSLYGLNTATAASRAERI